MAHLREIKSGFLVFMSWSSLHSFEPEHYGGSRCLRIMFSLKGDLNPNFAVNPISPRFH